MFHQPDLLPVPKKIVYRYEHTVEGLVIVDVAARRVEDLYENFDKTAPFHKKDLDEDLAYYLREWVNHLFAVKGTPSFLNTFIAEGLTIVA